MTERADPYIRRMISEKDFLAALRSIGRTPEVCMWNYNPLEMIKVANGLLHWKDKRLVVALLNEYIRVMPSDVGSQCDDLQILFRVIFDSPAEAGFPELHIGAPGPPAPKNLSLIPRFPIIIEQDIPFVLVNGYMIHGTPEFPKPALKKFAACCALRDECFAPSCQPFTLVRSLGEQGIWKLFEDDEDVIRVGVGRQLLRLVESVFRPDVDVNDWLSIDWNQMYRVCGGLQRQFDSLEVKWDRITNDYARARSAGRKEDAAV